MADETSAGRYPESGPDQPGDADASPTQHLPAQHLPAQPGSTITWAIDSPHRPTGIRPPIVGAWIALALLVAIGAFIAGQATGTRHNLTVGPASSGSATVPAPSPSTTSASAVTTGSAEASGSAGGMATSGQKSVPGLRGENLASVAAWAGKFAVHYSAADDSGRGRSVILMSDWQVCHTTPAEGAILTAQTDLRLGVVKTDETCPVTPRPLERPSAATGTMPDVAGMVLSQVNVYLTAHGASTSVKDLVRGRPVLVESNWQICTQSIPTGRPLPTGSYVKLGVVKYGERCP